jgi:uncharacterized membrane protein YozB (DUF420 family)
MKIIKQTTALILAIIAVILIIVIFLNPPTDFDDGAMMTYNFLFFFPLVFFAGILSITSILIAVIKLVRKKTEKKTLKIIALSLSTPVFIYFLSVAVRMIIVYNHAYDGLDDVSEEEIEQVYQYYFEENKEEK